MTLYQFFNNIKDNPIIQEYIEYLKDTKGSGYVNAYFENGGKHYPSYPLPEFKYHNVKGYLAPIYWGGDYKGNLYYELFGTNEPLSGYTIFGEFTGSLSMGNYGSGQGFIRPYMKSKDSDSHDMWRYAVSIRTASKFLDGKYWTPQNFDSKMSFYHYLALDSSAVRKIKKESQSVLSKLLDQVLLKIQEDQSFQAWKNGAKQGIIGKDVEVPLNLQDVFIALKREVGRDLKIDQETPDEIQCSIRHWGRWEHDYEDYDRDEEDFEDDDYMLLSDASYEKMDRIIKELLDKFEQVSIEWGTSEKNWIDFTISRKLEESLNEEDVNEKVKLIMRNILSKMVPAAFGASTNPKMRDEIKDAIETAIEPILKKYDYIVESQNILNEKNFEVEIESQLVKFSISTGYTRDNAGKLMAMAPDSKELDKLIEIGDKFTIGKALEEHLNATLKKMKSDIKVTVDFGWDGAGYAFNIDMEDLIKKLNK